MPPRFDPRRRGFLQLTGTGALALGLLPRTVLAAGKSEPAPIQLPRLDEGAQKTAMPTALPMNERVGIAIVGLGRLALEEVLPAIAACRRVRVTALVSGDAAKAKRVAAMYGVPQKAIYDYAKMDELAKNTDVQAVYIITPNGLHLEHTTRAAKAGKHVLCEKPMATTVEDAQKMVSVCDTARKKLMIAYRIQYEPHHRAVMQWVRNQDLGAVRLITLENCQAQSRENLSQWRLKKELSGGGALPDVGIYCLNTARFLLGEEPVEVGGTLVKPAGDPRFAEVEEAVTWWMRFPSGVVANCTTSYGTFDSKRYRVLAQRGWAEMDPAFPYKGLSLKRARYQPGGVDGASVTLGIEALELEAKNQFALEMDHFAACVRGDERPYTPGEEGVADMRILKAIYESCAQGKSVKLDGAKALDAYRGTQPT